MANIITYLVPKVITVAEPFSYDYIEYIPFGDEVVAQANVRNFEEGEEVVAIAQVRSKECISGYGYIVYDEQVAQSFVIDISLFKSSKFLN